MSRKRVTILLNVCFLLAAQASCSICAAQTLSNLGAVSPSTTKKNDPDARTATSQPSTRKMGNTDPDPDPATDSNPLGVTFLEHLISDQKSIWTSPSRLRWSDGAWLFPLAAASGGFLASDRAVPPALSTNPSKLNRYIKVSDYGLYSMIGAGGGLYLWSKIT